MRALAFIISAEPCRLMRKLLLRLGYRIIQCPVLADGNLYCLMDIYTIWYCGNPLQFYTFLFWTKPRAIK
jgi:hypothetical protein